MSTCNPSRLAVFTGTPADLSSPNEKPRPGLSCVESRCLEEMPAAGGGPSFLSSWATFGASLSTISLTFLASFLTSSFTSFSTTFAFLTSFLTSCLACFSTAWTFDAFLVVFAAAFFFADADFLAFDLLLLCLLRSVLPLFPNRAREEAS